MFLRIDKVHITVAMTDAFDLGVRDCDGKKISWRAGASRCATNRSRGFLRNVRSAHVCRMYTQADE